MLSSFVDKVFGWMEASIAADTVSRLNYYFIGWIAIVGCVIISIFQNWAGLDILCWLPSDFKQENILAVLAKKCYYGSLEFKRIIDSGVNYAPIFETDALYRLPPGEVEKELRRVEGAKMVRLVEQTSTSPIVETKGEDTPTTASIQSFSEDQVDESEENLPLKPVVINKPMFQYELQERYESIEKENILKREKDQMIPAEYSPEPSEKWRSPGSPKRTDENLEEQTLSSSSSSEWNQSEEGVSPSPIVCPILTEKVKKLAKTPPDEVISGGKAPSLTRCLPRVESSSGVEGTSFEEDDEIIPGEDAVVVGIHPRGLIVQSLPKEKEKSEFLLLDGLSMCRSSHRFNVAKADVKLIHVFLKVIFHSKLQTPIINENGTDPDEKEKIEKRVGEYALNKDTWCERQKSFRRGRREMDKFIPEKRDQKHVCLVVEPEEEGRKDLFRAVGPSIFYQSFLVQTENTSLKEGFVRSSPFKKHQYFMANTTTADPFFKQAFMFNTLCIIKKYDEEKRHSKGIEKWEKVFEEYKTCLCSNGESIDESILLRHVAEDKNDPLPGDPLLFDMRPLRPDEEKLIQTCCRDIRTRQQISKSARKRLKHRLRKTGFDLEDDDDEYEKFRLYIQDVALCICRLNSYRALQESQYMVKTRARLIDGEKDDTFIQIHLYPDQIKQVLQENTPWRPGAEMKLHNPVFKRPRQSRFGLYNKSDVEVIIDKIEYYQAAKKEPNSTEENNEKPPVMERRARIKLRPTKNSDGLFAMIRKYPDEADFSKELSQIGPPPRDGASETFATGIQKFKAFYKNRSFFNWYLGNTNSGEDEDLSYLDKMARIIKLQNNIYLDESQSKAVQHAHNKKGFTCIGAGPGSGKTLLCGALVCRGFKVRPKGRMLITATTNMAVNNQVRRVVAEQQDFPITREVSKRGEPEMDKNLEKYCLRHQSLYSPQTDPLLLQVRKDYAKVEEYYQKAKIFKESLNRWEMLHYAESKVKRYYLRIVVPFCGASTPALLVRHADHYNWVEDKNYSGKLVRHDMKHLIVDEASQMSYIATLALFCSFPQLERVTIIGDAKQLGPHCTLPDENDLLYEMCNKSELDRINGLRTVDEYFLERNYRSPSFLVNQFIQPYHGPNFKPVRKPSDRSLAFDKKMPLFQTESVESVKPVAFINILDGESCENESERKGVLKLIWELMNRNVKSTGITIVCFHRKQKEELEKCLREAGGQLGNAAWNFVKSIDVHTVNSFQGRENDIIILCTTKTVKYSSRDKSVYERIFQFVADKRRGLVAVSRAKEAMYVFGQWQYLRHTTFWKDHVITMKRKNLLYDEDWQHMR